MQNMNTHTPLVEVTLARLKVEPNIYTLVFKKIEYGIPNYNTGF